LIILDANILVYASNIDAPEHRAAQRWLENLISSTEIIGLPWVTIWALLRISTNQRIRANPLSTRQAFSLISEWLEQPGIVLIQAGPRHFEILERLVAQYGVAGTLVTDAVLAALAIENGASLASTDRDFSRFSELKWINPLTA
jgi:toxin-antitoxin system PIN domain toxin